MATLDPRATPDHDGTELKKSLPDAQSLIADPQVENPPPLLAPVAHSTGYCKQCSKIAWATLEIANKEVARMKESAHVKKPRLLDAYTCPHGDGFHIGHNFKLIYEFSDRSPSSDQTP